MDAPDRFRELSAWLAATDIAWLELRGPGTLLRLRRDGANGVEVVTSDGEDVMKCDGDDALTCDAGDGNGARAARPDARRHAADAHGTVAPTVVRSPCVGVLRRRHPLHDAPLVAEGQRVVAGQPLALLQIGPTLVPAAAPRDGVVARLVACDGAAVGYGDALLELL